MRVDVEVLGSVKEPYLQVQREDVLGMMLRPGSVEVGLRRSRMRMVKFAAGEMGCSRVIWNGGLEPADQERLIIGISDVALMATCDGMSGEVELRHQCRLVDTRVGGLVAAVNAERIAGFPSGRLFLDSIEQALAVALVNGYAVQPFCADAPRRTRSRTLANDQRAGAREDGRRVDPLRYGAIGAVKHRSFFTDVSQLNRREPSSVCPASKDRACEGNAARGRDAGTGCRSGLRFQNSTTSCAGVPPDVRSQPYGISARIRETRSCEHCPQPTCPGRFQEVGQETALLMVDSNCDASPS